MQCIVGVGGFGEIDWQWAYQTSFIWGSFCQTEPEVQSYLVQSLLDLDQGEFSGAFFTENFV